MGGRGRGGWGQGEGAQSVGTDRGENEKGGRGGSLSVRWFHPLTLIVCVSEWRCPVSRAKGVFLLPPCVCHLSPPLVALPPVHFMQVHPDVYSCVVEGCPLETKERLSTMTSPVHVDNVTQWLQTTRVLSYS